MSSKQVPCPCPGCRGKLVSNYIRKKHTTHYFSKLTEKTVDSVKRQDPAKEQVQQADLFLHHSLVKKEYAEAKSSRDHGNHRESYNRQPQLLVSCKSVDSNIDDQSCLHVPADSRKLELTSPCNESSVSATKEICEVSYCSYVAS